MLLATGSTGRCHALRHTFCNLFTLQLTCEKDVGMGLCTFNFVLRLSLHLVCLLFGTSSLHLCDRICEKGPYPANMNFEL